MSLCTLCQSLDFLNVTKLPDSFNLYHRQNESSALISVLKRRTPQADIENKANTTQTPDDETLGTPFHENLSDLKVAAEACSVCNVVAQDVNIFQTAFNAPEREEQNRRLRKKGPDWKMYLAKGVNDISGFLVVAHDVENKSVVWVVSAVGISVDGDDPLADVVAGRKISVDAKDEETMERAVKWIEECDKGHGCKLDDAELPARVLDVNGGVSMYTSNGEKGKYAMLSYVSDSNSAYDQDAHKDGIDVKTLPQTFQDAITMTRKLGVQYLWVDALCNDLPCSSPAFTSIFSNAYITLSATSSPSFTHGMLTPRSPPTYTSFPSNHTSTTGTLYASALNKEHSLYPSNDRILHSEPLSQDVWALQERLFSRRILHFTSTQLYFECNAHFLSETGYKMISRTDTLDPSTRTFESDVGDETQKKVLLWKNVLEMYCRRPLSRLEDKLPALSNLARTLSHNDSYTAGLWHSRLISELIWQATGFAKSRTSESAVYRALSWSWASIDGPFGMFTPGYGWDGGEWVDLASVLDYHVALKNEGDVFGEVSDAWIKLRTPLEELSPAEDAPRKQVWKMKKRNGSGEDTIVIFDTLARAEKAKEGKLYAVVLMKSGRSGRANYHAVIVKPAERKEGTYMRVGKVMFDDETMGRCEWMGDEGKKVDVVLV